MMKRKKRHIWNIRTEGENIQNNEKLPEIIVFAGPNGSGKSTITKMRENAVENKIGFTFENVMSTERNLKLLQRAKEQGYFIRCIYVLTSDVNINVMRVESRKAFGGHGVPEE